MRRILLTTALVALAPLAFAQMNPPVPANPSAVIVESGVPAKTVMTTTTVTNPLSDKPDPQNCGTPFDPKPCPPMPRVPLQYYPANRP